MELSNEIDLILSEGYGLGIDKAIIELARQSNQIQRKIHLMKMVKFGEYLQECLLKSGLKEEEVEMLHFNSGWGSAEDMGGYGGDQFWVFDIEPSKSGVVRYDLLNRLYKEINTEIAGLGKVNPRFLPNDETETFTTSFAINPIFVNLKDSFLVNTVNKEDLTEFSAKFLQISLKNKSSTKINIKKV